MQIIQSIRDKGAAIVITVIALSLIGFILMDAQQGGSKLFSSLSSNVGKVNGEAIEVGDFNKRVKQSEDMQRGGGSQSNQVRENMWNQMVAEKVFFAETEKLGINLSSSELRDILLSNEQNNPLLNEPGMKDSVTGKLDLAKAQAALTNIKKFKGEQRDMVDAQIIDPLKISTAVTKYTGLLNASVYYPAWMQEKEAKEAKEFAIFSYVNLPYSEITDSTIKVTDADVNEYVQKHKNMSEFKLDEGGRTISYIAFSQLANRDDSDRCMNFVAELKNPFAADTNSKAFVTRNASVIEYADEFVPKSKLSPAIADTITKAPIGTVIGPYLDKNNYVLAKYVATKEVPDSTHARHILIPLNDNGITRTDSVAKQLADSILTALNGGANFEALSTKYSSDQVAKVKGGDLGTFARGIMVAEFDEYSFTKPIGSKGIVKTQFGYHVVEILGRKSNPGYNVIYMAKEITPSEATISNAQIEATKASNQKTAAELAKYVSKKGLKLTQEPTMLKENDFRVGQMQDARPLVRWAFEAKPGDVSEYFNIGDQFIVAQLDKINPKGLKDAAAARPGCEAVIRNKKKADIIIKKIGANAASLESVASANQKQVQVAGLDSSITMASQFVPGFGVESKLIGAAFNKENQTKVSAPIAGTSGVYLIKVSSVQSKAADTPEEAKTKADARKSALRSQVGQWFDGLKKKADITDNRSKYF